MATTARKPKATKPNPETIAAMEEARKMSSTPNAGTVAAMKEARVMSRNPHKSTLTQFKEAVTDLENIRKVGQTILETFQEVKVLPTGVLGELLSMICEKDSKRVLTAEQIKELTLTMKKWSDDEEAAHFRYTKLAKLVCNLKDNVALVRTVTTGFPSIDFDPIVKAIFGQIMQESIGHLTEDFVKGVMIAELKLNDERSVTTMTLMDENTMLKKQVTELNRRLSEVSPFGPTIGPGNGMFHNPFGGPDQPLFKFGQYPVPPFFTGQHSGSTHPADLAGRLQILEGRVNELFANMKFGYPNNQYSGYAVPPACQPSPILIKDTEDCIEELFALKSTPKFFMLKELADYVASKGKRLDMLALNSIKQRFMNEKNLIIQRTGPGPSDTIFAQYQTEVDQALLKAVMILNNFDKVSAVNSGSHAWYWTEIELVPRIASLTHVDARLVSTYFLCWKESGIVLPSVQKKGNETTSLYGDNSFTFDVERIKKFLAKEPQSAFQQKYVTPMTVSQMSESDKQIATYIQELVMGKSLHKYTTVGELIEHMNKKGYIWDANVLGIKTVSGWINQVCSTIAPAIGLMYMKSNKMDDACVAAFQPEVNQHLLKHVLELMKLHSDFSSWDEKRLIISLCTRTGIKPALAECYFHEWKMKGIVEEFTETASYAANGSMTNTPYFKRLGLDMSKVNAILAM